MYFFRIEVDLKVSPDSLKMSPIYLKLSLGSQRNFLLSYTTFEDGVKLWIVKLWNFDPVLWDLQRLTRVSWPITLHKSHLICKTRFRVLYLKLTSTFKTKEEKCLFLIWFSIDFFIFCFFYDFPSISFNLLFSSPLGQWVNWFYEGSLGKTEEEIWFT